MKLSIILFLLIIGLSSCTKTYMYNNYTTIDTLSVTKSSFGGIISYQIIVKNDSNNTYHKLEVDKDNVILKEYY